MGKTMRDGPPCGTAGDVTARQDGWGSARRTAEDGTLQRALTGISKMAGQGMARSRIQQRGHPATQSHTNLEPTHLRYMEGGKGCSGGALPGMVSRHLLARPSALEPKQLWARQCYHAPPKTSKMSPQKYTFVRQNCTRSKGTDRFSAERTPAKVYNSPWTISRRRLIPSQRELFSVQCHGEAGSPKRKSAIGLITSLLPDQRGVKEGPSNPTLLSGTEATLVQHTLSRFRHTLSTWRTNDPPEGPGPN